MEMDMNMDNNQTDEGELVPIAHVGGHNHGMPILEMPLKPAEKLYWENYNTTTYFTFDETKFKHGIKKSFLKYHVFMIVTLTVISYPILLALNNINNKWYIFALIINFFVISGMFSILVFHNQLKRNHIHLYENNCYSFLNILLTTLLSLHLISGIVKKVLNFICLVSKNVKYMTTKCYTWFLIPMKETTRLQKMRKILDSLARLVTNHLAAIMKMNQPALPDIKWI